VLQSLPLAERYNLVVDNIATGQVWHAATTRHALTNTRSVIQHEIQAAASKASRQPGLTRKDKQGDAGGAKKDTKKRPLPPSTSTSSLASSGSSHSLSPEASNPPRCKMQDEPGGCSFGLTCKYEHDADKPKTASKKAGKAKKAKRDDEEG
jgi:hypothetical protein